LRGIVKTSCVIGVDTVMIYLFIKEVGRTHTGFAQN
jgi:hypothetical protein